MDFAKIGAYIEGLYQTRKLTQKQRLQNLRSLGRLWMTMLPECCKS